MFRKIPLIDYTIAKGDPLPKLATGQLPLQLGISMTIRIEKVAGWVTYLDDIDVERERVKIVFESGKGVFEEVFFKIDEKLYIDRSLILDTELTNAALVDEILIPKGKAWDMNLHDDIFSIITKEQCRQLRIALLCSGRQLVPRSGNGMYIWKTSKVSMTIMSRHTIMKGRTLKTVKVVMLDS
jgi:hypothetical protein